MSRIHEALKKAQQDRTRGAQPSAAEAAQGIPVTEPVIRTNPASAAEHPASAAVPVAEEVRERISLAELLGRCQPRPWKPDLRSMLFFNGRAHVDGMEEFRTLRARLYQVREKQPLQTLLVTSALPGEGKTFVAANLAQAIVRQHERRALLIDTDLRQPQLHVALGAAPSPGLTEYLQDKADEFAILQRSSMENLFFIARGQAAPNPSELLGNGRFRRLLRKLAHLFDWIVLDSPAAIAVADASQLAQESDGLLLVVRAAATPYDLAQKVRQEFADRFLVGVVLNHVEPREAYGYYSAYYAKEVHSKPEK